MSQRKLQQDIDKVFKQVEIGVEAFDAQYEKYEQSTNASQRDKLVDSIKKECKKLQRLRDQIKTWAAGNEVKDKGPLQDKRELIETKMEAFKAVEKEMKTKAFSKEGLSVSAKIDPKEREKDDMGNFLREMVEELGHQIEAQEAETAQLHAQQKKSKKDNAKTERLSEIEHRTERHKWHQDRLELLMRALANDDVEPDQVKGAQDDIKHYVENNQEVDFFEDEGIYDEFNLDEEGGRYGVHGDMDRVSSHDNQSNHDDGGDSPAITEASKVKPKNGTETAAPPARRPSQHIKSPFPTLATLNNLPTATAATVPTTMKPAPPPSKPPGETLKYASAAAAAASTDTTGIGITPLPPPPNKPSAVSALSAAAGPSGSSVKSSATTSPAVQTAQPALTTVPSETRSIPSTTAEEHAPASTARSPAPSQSSASGPSPAVSTAQLTQASASEQSQIPAPNGTPQEEDPPHPAVSQSRDQETASVPDGHPSDMYGTGASQANGVERTETEEDESVYHLPSNLQELIDGFEAVKSSAVPVSQPEHQRMLAASFASRPDSTDAERPHHYKPQNPAIFTPSHYPQEPLPIFDDPRLYQRVDHDALFYSFYYKQGTYQQYLAAKALKAQSWRFHKQYQTWFQRHEEPKSITEDYEQGTYRFFDYESTWMNRRKADFKFAYKFLEDEL